MKKQRILALALTATMAMSVFGGMSASAADDVDGYKPYTAKTLTISDLDTAAEFEKIYTEGYEDLTRDDFADYDYFLFDYTPANQNTVSYDNVTDAILKVVERDFASDDSDGTKAMEAARTALTAYYGASVTVDKTVNMNLASDTREAIVNAYNDQLELVEAINKDFYYTASDSNWVYYGAEDLIEDVKEVKDLDAANSTLYYLAIESERIVPELEATSSYEEMYNAKYDELASRPSSDYTTTNYRKLTRILEDAEDMIDGTEAGYSKAYTYLCEKEKIETITPDWSDLKAAVEGLFTNGKPIEGPYEGTPESTYYYTTADYDKTSYEWVVFAGGTYDDEDITGAYEIAYEVYEDCRYSSTRKYVGQSVVDNALAALDEALLNLDPNFSSKNWVIVMLEDALDSANEIVESDYKTTSSYWKKYLAAVENVEKLLDATAVRETVAADAVKALETAIKNLTKCQISIDSDMRADMTAAKKEAKALLKDKSNKTASQIIALQTALDAAEDTTTSATVSVYEAALNDLQTAITGYSQVQGWYQQNGTWYYGVGDTTAKGWLNLNGTWYYLDPTTGAMATGWLQLGNTWYYLQSWGGMVTGWQQVNGSWYYFQSWGGMVSNGWYWIGGSCYYFYNWGGMAANTTIDGYTVNASGAWVR